MILNPYFKVCLTLNMSATYKIHIFRHTVDNVRPYTHPTHGYNFKWPWMSWVTWRNFNDTKHCAAFLRQLSFLCSYAKMLCLLFAVHSYKSVVCSCCKGWHATWLCCLWVCLRWNADPHVWRNGGIWQIFKWTLWAECIEVGVEETEAKTSKNWSPTMSTPW